MSAIAAPVALACACGTATVSDGNPNDASWQSDVAHDRSASPDVADTSAPGDASPMDRAADASGSVDTTGPEADAPATDTALADAPLVDAPPVDAPPPPPPPTHGWAPFPTPGPGLPPRITWFAEAPSNPDVIIAGGDASPKHGHFRSIDGGVSWRTLHQPSGLFPAVFAPADASIAYALQVEGTDTDTVLRVARSNDGGVTWQARGPALVVMSNIFVDPVNTDKIYIWRNPNDTAQVLSTSNDGGLTWTNSAPLPDLFVIDDMAIAPDEPSRIYAAISGGPDGTWALLASSNGGASWDNLASGPNSRWRAHRALAIAPSDPNVFYLLGPSLQERDGGARTPGICRSPNRGRTWSCHTAPPGSWRPDDEFDGSLIGVDARDPNTLFVSEQRSAELPLRLYRSADGGASWQETIQFGAWFDAALVSRVVSGRVLVASETPSARDAGRIVKDGIARSSDSGSTFTTVIENLNSFAASTFVVARNDDKILFQWSDDDWEPGYFTTDRGAQWRKLGPMKRPDAAVFALPLQQLLSNAVGHPTDPRSAFMGTRAWTLTVEADGALAQTHPSSDGLPINHDAGRTWSDALYGCSIGVDVPAVRYCCTAHGLYRTSDAGQHWSPTAHTGHCEVSRVDVSSSAIVYVLSRARMFRTDDGGAHFAEVTPPGLDVPCDASECFRLLFDIILDEGDPSRVFAMVLTGVTPYASYVYSYRESHDRGATWMELPGRFPRQRLYPDPNDAKVLYAAGTGGVRKSRDGGQTWFDVVSGLDEYSVCKLHVSRQTPGIVYARACGDDRPQGGLMAIPEAGTGPLYWTATGGE